MRCPPCKGSGKTYDTQFEVYDPCPLCKGSGQALPGEVFNRIGDTDTLVLRFPTKDAALGFKTWLSLVESQYLEGESFALENDDISPEDMVSEILYHTGDNTLVFKN